MAKITLLPLYALLITFSLIWNHGNATTPRKLGVRHNTVTNLPNTNYEAIFDGSKHEDSHIPSSLAHANVIVPKGPLINPNEATSMKLGKHQNPIIITSLPNTNEAANSGEPGLRSSPISSTSTQTDATTHFYQSSTDTDETTTSKIKGRFSSSQMWQSLPFEATPRKLGARHNTVTSLSTSRKLGARHNAITSFPNTYKATSRGSANKATTNKLGARENPIIITSLPSTNEATNSRESVLHFSSISSSPTQSNRVFPRDPDEAGHVSSIIN
ncbi:hypothetical protein K7X08_031125 [Anisodus acutangulus]|uniref:Uncharacterized protein n=1 Tax=Anisodus acutangulus TaxID=402998 RepID=A0A9Q1MP36_9SOLA|nr:hypothetical protein K7X08_031125 [Anisodus acutangulus]